MINNSLSSLLTIFRQFLENTGLSKVSIKNYVSDVRKFLEFANLSSPEAINNKVIEEYLHTFSANKLTTRNRHAASLRRFCTFLETTYGLNLSLQLGNSTPTPTEDTSDLVIDFKKSLIESKKSDSTVKNYVSDVNSFIRWLSLTNPLTVNDINENNIKDYLQYLKVNQSKDSVIVRKEASLKQLLHFCHPQIAKPKTVAPLRWFNRFQKTQSHIDKPSNHPLKKLYYRYTSLPFTPYLHLAILVLFTAALALFGYNQVFKDTKLSQAFPSTLTRPTRQLSFQARLTDSSDTPITTSTNVSFKLWNQSSGGTEGTCSSLDGENCLYQTGTCSVTPDQDGIFNTLIGNGVCGSEIASNVFTENQNIYLEVLVGASTLSPRQQIATVGYALNTETLQGYPAGTGINTIPYIDNSGDITIAAASPSIISTSGTFSIEGQAVSLTTSTASNGNITVAPDGTGQIQLLAGTTSTDSLRITNANLTSGSLISGYVGNNSSTGELLRLSSGSSETDRFVVGTGGQTTIDAIAKGQAALIINQLDSGPIFAASASGINQFLIANSGDITASGAISGLSGISSSGTISLSSLNTAGGIIYSSNVSGDLAVTTAGTTGQCLQSSGGGSPTWGACDAASAGYWQRNSQALAPTNISDDLLVGSSATASALFKISGTPGGNSWLNNGNFGIGTTDPSFLLEVNGTARINGNTTIGDASGDSLTVNAATLALTNASTLNLANSSTTALNIESGLLNLDTSNSRIGIGTTNPGFTLEVNGTTRINGNTTIGDASADTLTINANATSFVNASTIDLANSSTTALNIESGLMMFDTANSRVGIGSTAPGNTLTVQSSASGPVGNTGSYGFLVGPNAVDGVAIGDFTTFKAIQSFGGDPLSLNPAGNNVGIGVSIPSFLLEVGGSARINGNTTIGDASGDSLTVNAATLALTNASTLNLANSSTTSLNIESGLMNFDTSNGRVGINTTAPSERLHVNGGYLLAGSSGVLRRSGVFGSSNHVSGDTNDKWIKLGEVTINGAWSGAGFDMEIWRATMNHGVAKQKVSVHALNDSTTFSGAGIKLISEEGNSNNAKTLKDVRAVHISGSGVTNNVVAFWVQMQDTWITGSPVEIRYYGTWNAGPYLTTQPQQASITDAGTAYAQNEYDFAGNIYIAGNLGIGNTSPSYKLDVTGDGRFTTNLSVNGNTTIGDASGDTLTINASTVDLTNSSATALNIESGLLNFNTATSRIGIGSTAAPDAWLDIAAATTSKAQLNLTSSVGVGPTSPVSGDLWWDGTNLNFYTGSGTIDLTDAGMWTDGGTYVYPTNAETLGNSASAGSNKLTGIYLSDSSPLTLGTDNDTTFSFNNTTSSLDLALGSNDLSVDAGTLVVDGSANRVGIGTTAPSNLLTINGTADITTSLAIGDTAPAAGKLFVRQTGTDNSSGIALFNSGGTASARWYIDSGLTQRIDNGAAATGNIVFNGAGTGYVGIGTTLPGFTLEVNGTARINGNTTIGDASGDSLTVNAATLALTNASTLNLANSSTTSLNIESGLMNFDTSNSRVGINTTSPQAVLDISSGGYSLMLGADNNAITRTDATDKVARIMVPHRLNAEEPLMAMFSTGSVFSFGGGSSLGNAATDLRFYTAANDTTLTGSERMRITSAGNVGIGTTLPGYLLEVNGTARINGNTTIGDASGDTLTINANATTFANASTVDIANSSTTSLNIESGLMNFDTSNSRIGIGTTAPGFSLEVNGTARINGNTTIGDASADTLTINASTVDLTNSSATALNIESGLLNFNTATSRIGIGSTAAPDAWLDIAAATTSKAQLNLTSSVGVGPSSPVSGDLWWDGTALNFYNGSITTNLLAGAIWTDAGTYIYPTNGETLGNSASAGSNKLTGIYLSDSSPLTLGTDNDTTFSFNNTTSTLELALGSNDLSVDAGTLVVDGSANRVGIGTTAPNSALTVAGDITPSADNTYDLGSSSYDWQDLNLQGTISSSGVTMINIATQTFAGSTDWTFAAGAFFGGGTTYYINSAGTGNLNNLTLVGTTGLTLSGIGADATFSGTGTHTISASAGTLELGTATVAGDLTIATNVNIVPAGTTGTNNIGSAGIPFDNLYVNTIYQNGTTLDSQYVNVGGDTMTGTLTFSGVASDITTGTNEHLALMPNGSGNVGIGTTNPGYLLEVNGTARINGNTTIGDASADTLTINANATTFVNASTIDLANSSTTSLRIEGSLMNFDTSNSRIGIGTTAPNDLLEINGGGLRVTGNAASATGTNSVTLGHTGSGGYGWLQSWNSTPLNLNPQGNNVGIGTTLPSSALQVAGRTTTTDFTMTNGATNGYFLSSDASGNASWTNIGTSGTAGPWTLSGSTIYPDDIAYDVLIGSQTTSDGVGLLTVNGYRGANALVVFDQDSSNGDILTASASGTTRARLTYGGSLLFNQASTIDATGTLSLNTTNNQAITTGNGQITLAGNVDATNGLDVTTANLTVGGANFSVVPGTGNITTAGDLALNGGDITRTGGSITITPSSGSNLNVALATTGDFAVNTDDLYVDTSAGFTGIGTTAPASLLDIGDYISLGYESSLPAEGSITEANWNSYILANAAGNRTLRLGVSNDNYTRAEIELENNNTNNGTIYFKTTNAVSTPPAMRMTILPNGNVGIGNTNPTGGLLQVAGRTYTTDFTMTNGATAGYILQSNSSGDGTWIDPSTLGGSSGAWTYSAPYIFPDNVSDYVAIGTITTTAAEMPSVLTVNGYRGANALVVFDQDSSNGDILTASASGTTRARLTYGGSLLFNQASTIDATGTLSLNTTNNQAITTGNGQITLAGNVDATNGLDVTTANLTVGGANFSVVPGTGNITTAGDLALNGGNLTTSVVDLNINSGGGQIIIADTDTLLIGGTSGAFTYNSISNSGGAPTNANVADDNDLYIQGDLEIDGEVYAANSGVFGYWQRTSQALAPTNISDDLLVGSSATASARFKISGTPGNNSWLASGNFGIGTTNPSNILDVVGGGIGVYRTGNAPYVLFNRDATTIGQIRGVASNRLGITDSGSSNEWVSFTTDTGRVGIGITSPGYLLEVNGTARINGNTTIGDASADTLTINANATSFVNASTIDLANSSTTSLNIESGLMNFDTSNSRIGIGTTAPLTTLGVVGTSATATGNGIIRFDTNSGSNDAGIKMGALAGAASAGYAYIQGVHTGVGNDLNLILNPVSGNVGIGVTVPGFLLEVGGTARINGNTTIGDASADTLTINANATSFVNASTIDLANTQVRALNIENGLMNFDTTNTRIGIGTTTPTSRLEVVDTSATSPRGILSTQYSSDANGAQINLRKARNTIASPTAVSPLDNLGNLVFSGYGTSFAAGAQVAALASQTWNGSNNGTILTFSNVPENSTTMTERMRITEKGWVGIGASAVTMPLQVATTSGTLQIASFTCASGDCYTLQGNGTQTARFGVDGSGSFFGSNSNHDFRIVTNNATRVTMNWNGSNGFLYPAADNTYDLGNSSNDWRYLNLQAGIYSGGTEVMNVATRTLSGGGDWSINNGLTIGEDLSITCTGVGAGNCVTVGGGTGKIDVGTIDPPYTINGEKYATYLPAMVGQREEVTGKIATSEYVENLGYRYNINLTNQPTASDLWLFGKVTNLVENLDDLTVILTPTSQAKVWYEVDEDSKIISIYSSKPTTISYRLSSTRFDEENWTNTRTTDSVGFVLNSPENNNNLVATTPITIPLFEQITPDKFQLKLGSSLVEELGSFANLLVANLEVGIGKFREIRGEKIVSPFAQIDELEVKQLAALDATVSGTLFATEIESPTLNQITLSQDEIQNQIESLTSDYATASSILADIQSKYSSFDQLLQEVENASLSAQYNLYNSPLIVAESIMINSTLITNSISSNDQATLYLQPAGGEINLLAGVMTLSPDGKVVINGDLTVSGKVVANNSISSSLETNNATISGNLNVASLTASGSATFQDLVASKSTSNELVIASAAVQTEDATNSAVINSNATIGTATIKAGETQIFINTTKVDAGTLVYLTPISDTKNQVVFVQSKEEGVGFTTAINAAIDTDIKFNYWLIKTL